MERSAGSPISVERVFDGAVEVRVVGGEEHTMRVVEATSAWTTIEVGDLVLKYRLREPSPDLWNAMGLICSYASGEPIPGGPRLIVGIGGNPAEAMTDMIAAAIRQMGGDVSARDRIRRPTTA